jgi:hypothetical protein
MLWGLYKERAVDPRAAKLFCPFGKARARMAVVNLAISF